MFTCLHDTAIPVVRNILDSIRQPQSPVHPIPIPQSSPHTSCNARFESSGERVHLSFEEVIAVPNPGSQAVGILAVRQIRSGLADSVLAMRVEEIVELGRAA